MKVRVTGFQAALELSRKRGKEIRPWYADRVGEELELDTKFSDVYMVKDGGRYKTIIKGDGEIVEE